MQSIFVAQDWFLVFIFIFLISLVTILPDLYSIYKNEKRWVPVNFPPYMVGDEYHYFSILNFVHRRCLNFFFNYNLTYPKLIVGSKFQLAGFLFNLPAYHLGFLYRDRRYGILFVRLWNSLCLGFSFLLLYSVVVSFMQINQTTFYPLFAAYIFYILFYPGPFRAKSIFANLSKKNFMFKHEHANDLCRAMFSSTSAPLFLFSMALLIYTHSINYSNLILNQLVLAPIVILFFVYLPISIVYGFSVMLSSLLNQNYIILVSSAITLIALMFFYIYTIKKDELAKEVYAHSDQDVIFIYNFRLIIRVVAILTPCLLIALYLVYKQFFFMGLLILLFGSFSFTLFFKKHQLSRFYDRASCIALQALTAIFLILFVDNSIFYLPLVIFLLTLLIFFYHRQALNLYENYSTTAAPSIYEKMNFSSLFFKFNKNSNYIATDSHIVSGFIDVFGSDEPLLRHYSIQYFGYKKNLQNTCKNFIALGYSFEDFKKIFFINVKRSDWLDKRPFPEKSIVFDVCKNYSLQMVMCYREYNNEIISDGMYNPLKGWTGKFENLLLEVFNNADSQKTFNNLIVI